MSADQFAQLAAGILAVCAGIAGYVGAILLGPRRRPGMRTRGAALGALITLAVGSLVNAIVENQASDHSGHVANGLVRLAISLALIGLAVGVYQDDLDYEPTNRTGPADGLSL